MPFNVTADDRCALVGTMTWADLGRATAATFPHAVTLHDVIATRRLNDSNVCTTYAAPVGLLRRFTIATP